MCGSGPRLSTMVLRDADSSDPHWLRNHKITCATLTEDFEIGEGIQAGLTSGANTALTFGQYEGALAAFSATVNAAMAT